MAGNSNLKMSKDGKTDEFYTQLSLVESEMKHYEKHFFMKSLSRCSTNSADGFQEV